MELARLIQYHENKDGTKVTKVKRCTSEPSFIKSPLLLMYFGSGFGSIHHKAYLLLYH